MLRESSNQRAAKWADYLGVHGDHMSYESLTSLQGHVRPFAEVEFLAGGATLERAGDITTLYVDPLG